MKALLLLFLSTSAFAEMSSGVMIQGRIENFDQKKVELNVRGKRVVVPRNRITERLIRPGVYTSALLPVDEIKPSPYRRIAADTKSPLRRR